MPDPREFDYGAVVADEANAAVAAREALVMGGSAADAAVAAYFTLAVTMPSTASLGGGGACLVHDPASGSVEMLDFIAPASKDPRAADRPTAIPANVRGMAMLYARYGRLPWQVLLSRAEQLARDGSLVSPSLAADLERAAEPLFADSQARAVFARTAGGPLQEHDPLRQIELASVLAQIRGRGPGVFYVGYLAQRVVEAVHDAGGTLTVEELRDYRPEWRKPASVETGQYVFHGSAPPAAAGTVAAQIWRMIAMDDRYARTPAEERPHLLAEAARRAFAGRSAWQGVNGDASSAVNGLLAAAHAGELMASYDATRATPADDLPARGEPTPENSSGTGFVVVDGSGLAVSCVHSLYNLFGTGRLAPGIGIFLAQEPGVGSHNPLSLGPVMATDAKRGAFLLGLAGAGGAAVPTSVVAVAARTLLEGKTLEDAIHSPRVHADSPTGPVWVEEAETPARIETLQQRGHLVRRHYGLGRINGVYCREGLPAEVVRQTKCEAVADTRGFGLGLTVLHQRGTEQ